MQERKEFALEFVSETETEVQTVIQQAHTYDEEISQLEQEISVAKLTKGRLIEATEIARKELQVLRTQQLAEAKAWRWFFGFLIFCCCCFGFGFLFLCVGSVLFPIFNNI